MAAVIGRTAISRHHSRLGYPQLLLGAGRYSIAGRFFSSGGYASLLVQGASRKTGLFNGKICGRDMYDR